MNVENAAYVDAGNLAPFVSALPALYQSDILDSTLLAQLAADKKYSRFDETGRWQEVYTSTLGQLYWHITSFSHRQHVPTEEMFSLEDLVLDSLRKIATAAELSLVKETIGRFKALSDDDERVLVYAEFTHSGRIVDLQVSVADRSSRQGSVSIVFETDQEIMRNLFEERFCVAKLVGEIRIWSMIATLNEESYGKIRQNVIEKLGSKRDSLILSLYDNGDAQENARIEDE
jgi:hypothetical protein